MPRARGSLSVSNAGESRYGEGAATSGAPSVHSHAHNHHQQRIVELVQDIAYVARLRSKLVTLMTEEGPNGTVHLTPLFHQLDRKFRSRRDNDRDPAACYALDLWAFKSLFSPLGLSDVEAEVLFALFLDDADRDAQSFQQDATIGDDMSTMASTQRRGGATAATIDGAEVMLAVRKLCHNVSTQFHEILKRVRSRRVDPTSLTRDGLPFCTFYVPYHQRNEVPRKRDVFDFLTKSLGLTDSEAFLCLEYFTLAGEQQGTTSPDRGTSPADSPPQAQHTSYAAPSLDIGYVCAALFEHPLPDDVAFPLLMSKVVEAITNPNRGDLSGIPTVLEELLFFSETLHADGSQRNARRIKPKPMSLEELKAFEDRCDTVAGPETPYSGAVYVPCRSELAVRWLDLPLFRRFCLVMNLGIPSAEVELLFSYLASPESGGSLLQQSVLMEQLILRYPKIPLPEVYRVAGMVRQQLLSQDVHGLNALHTRLSVFENRPIPPLSFRAILRQLGTSPVVLPSVLLDAIRRVAPRCVQVVSLIRGPLPPSRTETLEKLYILLLEDSGRHPTSKGSQRRRTEVSPARVSTRRDRFVNPSKADALHQEAYTEQPTWAPTRSELLQIAVPTSALLRRYTPELATGLISPAQVPTWRRHLEAYLDFLPDDDTAATDAPCPDNGATSSSLTVTRRLLDGDDVSHGTSVGVAGASGSRRTHYITFEELAYYWGNVSPAIGDDAQFTLILWKSFSMHRGALHLPTGNATTPTGDATSARQSVAPQQNERRMLRD